MTALFLRALAVTLAGIPAVAPAAETQPTSVPGATIHVPAAAPAPAPLPVAPVSPVPPAPTPATPTAVDPNALPPMNYYASVAADELLKRIKAVPAFGRLEKDLYGSPIQLRITHSLQPTAGGQAAGLLSAIWAGGTLGLLPVVTNNNLVLTYEVRVNGKEIARYDFERSFTRAVNIWAEQNDPTYGLGQEGIEWARSTADQFAAKAAQDPAVLAVAKEYAFYFGPEQT